ncbi:D-alanine--D-alanine ligase [Thermotoga profunda]|uniref:D-alanine--D-alanine ligase n=1 Tax=Thermotoga profunda TaxID=1508420 RepID=UPI000597AB99|nr:D-alanine--D-alanine ligase [Thermotoga profunda]
MKIAVLFGGISRERPISLKSGQNVLEALKKLGHEAYPIDVNGDFLSIAPKLKEFDLVFNALHGKFGEDGVVQAILDWLGIKYTGSKVLSSAICFDKVMTYRTLNGNVKYPEYILVKQPIRESPFGFPCVIKPRKEGSSIGVHICDNPEQLYQALLQEFSNYDEMIVQRYIPGRELTISILKLNGKPQVLPILELKPKRRFYDYIAKYTPNMTEFILPAPLSEQEHTEVTQSALKAFEVCECDGFARVDGILKDGIFYVLELNTIPGLTDLSDLPASAKAAGMSFEQLIDAIIRTVVE